MPKNNPILANFVAQAPRALPQGATVEEMEDDEHHGGGGRHQHHVQEPDDENGGGNGGGALVTGGVPTGSNLGIKLPRRIKSEDGRLRPEGRVMT